MEYYSNRIQAKKAYQMKKDKMQRVKNLLHKRNLLDGKFL